MRPDLAALRHPDQMRELGPVTVLALTAQDYDETAFSRDSVVKFAAFSDWALTADAMLAI